MLEYKSLSVSTVACVSSYSCTACRGGPAAEENSGGNKIVLMRHGVFSRHFGKQIATSDVNQVSFFSEGLSYRVSHPGDCGDRGTVLSVSSQILYEMIREFDPSINDHPERPFPFVTGPCDVAALYQHRQLVLALESVQSQRLNSLWVDEKVMQLVTGVLNAAFQHHGVQKRQHRPQTNRKHNDLVELTKSYVASRIGDHLTLNEIARAVGASPFHLTRIFRRYTGLPVYRYLVCLRLRTSLEMLAAGADDLTILALELGFSSHSHFSDSFRHEFGCSPSEMRKKLTCRSLRQMSKNLEV